MGDHDAVHAAAPCADGEAATVGTPLIAEDTEAEQGALTDTIDPGSDSAPGRHASGQFAEPDAAVSVADEQDLQHALEVALTPHDSPSDATDPAPSPSAKVEQAEADTRDSVDDDTVAVGRSKAPLPQDNVDTAAEEAGAVSHAEPAHANGAASDVQEPLPADDTAVGWRGVAGRLLGRARRVFGRADATETKPKKRRARRQSDGDSTTTPRRKRNASTKPRAKRAPAAAKKTGLWGRLLAGVGLATPAKPKAKRPRKPTTARSAPRKPRARRAAQKPVQKGLFARTLARFGLGGKADTEAEPTVSAPEGAASTDVAPALKKRATAKRASTPRKPASPRATKAKAKANAKPESAWRRALRRVLGRS